MFGVQMPEANSAKHLFLQYFLQKKVCVFKVYAYVFVAALFSEI